MKVLLQFYKSFIKALQKLYKKFWLGTLYTFKMWLDEYFSNDFSLIYNTSARHQRRECDTSNTNATRVRQ